MSTTVIPRTALAKWMVVATVSDPTGNRIKIMSEEISSVRGTMPMGVMERIRSLREAMDPKADRPMYVEGDDDSAVEIESHLKDRVVSGQVADAMWSFTSSSGVRVSGFVTNNV